MPFVSANIFQPLIDVFDVVIVFFHDTVGLPWGPAIIALTVVVRIVLIPLTIKQFRSMAALQQLAPEMKALQAKYKDDRQRLNQEMMKFYQENKVNPFGSCLPLLLQMPVFLALFFMLRKDLKLDMCGDALKTARREDEPASAGADQLRRSAGRGERRRAVPLHPRPDRQGDRRRAHHPDRPVRRARSCSRAS